MANGKQTTLSDKIGRRLKAVFTAHCAGAAGNDDQIQKQQTWADATVTISELARLLGKSQGAITAWTDLAGLRRRQDGRYHLQTAIRFCMEYYEQLRMPPLTLGRVNQQELGFLLGFTRITIRTWTRDGMPQQDDGTFDLRLVLRWLGRRYRSRYEKSSNSKEITDVESQ